MMNNQNAVQNESIHDINQGINALTLEEFNKEYSNVVINKVDGDIIYIEALYGHMQQRVSNKGVFITDKPVKESVLSILMANAVSIDQLRGLILLSRVVNIKQVEPNYFRIEFQRNPGMSPYLIMVKFNNKDNYEEKIYDEVRKEIKNLADKYRRHLLCTMSRVRQAMMNCNECVYANQSDGSWISYKLDNDITIVEHIDLDSPFGLYGISRKVTIPGIAGEQNFSDELSFLDFIGKHI